MTNGKKVLSASEGADRIAKKRNRPIHDDSEPIFTCESCGHREFRVIQTYEERSVKSYSLPCTCGAAEDAASRECVVTCIYEHVGSLGPDHRVEWDEDGPSMVDGPEEEETEAVTTCEGCLSSAEPPDWVVEEAEDEESDHTDDFWELHCAQCDHEIEFGWSHPDRGGRIWPCESSDFNPWLTFPENRFRDAWRQRGWLRPKGQA